jgi:hypothetical protein
MMTKLTHNWIAVVSSALRSTVTKSFTPAVLLAGGLAAAATPSAAQIFQQGPLEQISAKPQVIRAQVELGGKLANEAITILESTDEPEQLERAKDLVKRSYELLRYANAGCEIRKFNANLVETRLLTMAMDNINAARQRNITAGIAIGNSIPWPESRPQYMSDALDLLRPVPTLAQRAAPLIR